MRKYIHKFKNYTSVEVDNLHDLKEGDLALYEDKFLTRNNGKVEEVVKGSGSSSEDEYSTDYPDDFYLTGWTDGTGIFSPRSDNYPQHLSIYKNNTVIFNQMSNLESVLNNRGGCCGLEFSIPNIDLDSVVLIYKMYDGYDEDNLLTTGIIRMVNFGSPDSNIGLMFTCIPNSSNNINTLSIEFKQKGNPTKYLVDIGPINIYINNDEVTRYTPKTSYKVLRIKYTDIIGTN